MKNSLYKKISIDIISRKIRLYNQSIMPKDIASVLNLPIQGVYLIIKNIKITGSVSSVQRGRNTKNIFYELKKFVLIFSRGKLYATFKSNSNQFFSGF